VNFQVNLVPPRPHFHGLSDGCHAGADFDLVKKAGMSSGYSCMHPWLTFLPIPHGRLVP
jgi:hypothetical protein